MAILLSDYLEIDENDFESDGIFNSVLGVDTNLFLDPHLLKDTKIPEFEKSREKIKKYFEDIILILENLTVKRGHAWREVKRRLTFKEVQGVFIGYSVHTGDGKGIGPILAERLLKSAKEICDMGVLDPEIFELLGLFEEGFGADRLSDMTIAIIRDDIYQYTQNIVNKFDVKKPLTLDVEYLGKKYRLPLDPMENRPLLLLPRKLLRDLPVALDREGIDYVVAVNKELRDRLNRLIGKAWRSRMAKKSDRRIYIFNNKENLSSLIKFYTTKISRHYDFGLDPKGEVVWFKLGKEYAERNPIKLELESRDIDGLKKVVLQIIEQFKKNIENNGLNEHLYIKKDGKFKPRPEKYAQLLFFAAADNYCAANDLDLSREPNAGNGPVDFKISKGYMERILVEIKLSSNPRLLQGFEKQLPAYQDSESTKESFYLIIRNTKSDKNIKSLLQYSKEQVRYHKKIPEIIVVDGLIKPSASRR